MGTKDIGVQENTRPGYRPVNMAFGREINHIIRIKITHQTLHGLPVSDIALYELNILPGNIIGNRQQITGISQRIKHNNPHIIPITSKKILHKVAPDETGTAGNKIFLYIRHINSVYSTTLRLSKLLIFPKPPTPLSPKIVTFAYFMLQPETSGQQQTITNIPAI